MEVSDFKEKAMNVDEKKQGSRRAQDLLNKYHWSYAQEDGALCYVHLLEMRPECGADQGDKTGLIKKL